MGGGCYPSTQPQEHPNRGGPTVNTTSDMASNSTYKCTTAEQHMEVHRRVTIHI